MHCQWMPCPLPTPRIRSLMIVGLVAVTNCSPHVISTLVQGFILVQELPLKSFFSVIGQFSTNHIHCIYDYLLIIANPLVSTQFYMVWKSRLNIQLERHHSEHQVPLLLHHKAVGLGIIWYNMFPYQHYTFFDTFLWENLNLIFEMDLHVN